MASVHKITLAGLEEDHLKNVKMVVSHHGSRTLNLKPHKVFLNWKRHYIIPWICFLDFAVFVLYILLAVFHQKSTIAFTQDFSKAIFDYFLEDINLPDPPGGIPIGVGQIFFVDDFKFIFIGMCTRFFTFDQSFPVSFVIDSLNTVDLELFLQDSETITRQFTESEIDPILDQICNEIHRFKKVTVSANYHIQVSKSQYDYRMSLLIKCSFSKDLRTDTIFMDIEHSRIQEGAEIIEVNVTLYLFYTLPFLIIVLNVIAIIVFAKSTFSLYRYAKHRSLDIGIPQKEIFWNKFDKWDIFSVITHSISIASSIMYILVGQDIKKDIPPFLFVIALATLFHSFTLIRYLKLNPSTNLIIHVLMTSTVQIMQFLVGCLPIFFGFWAFGICFFGHLNEAFASPLQCAAFLFCVMHGDSIKDVYDAVIIQNDMSPYVGFVYTSLWVAFSLLLMFNITISIVQEVLTVETCKAHNRKTDEEQMPAFSVLANNLALMTSRRNI